MPVKLTQSSYKSIPLFIHEMISSSMHKAVQRFPLPFKIEHYIDLLKAII